MKTFPLIAVDMDGVIADLENGCINQPDWITELSQQNTQNRHKKIGEWLNDHSDVYIYKLFANLKPLPKGIKIIKFLQKNNIEFIILSKPLDPPKQHASIKGKKEWLKNNGMGNENAIFTGEKYKYAFSNNTPNILIDDYIVNIQKWEENKGIGIRYSEKTGDDALAILKNYLNFF